MSMAASIEVRVPFLDYKLVQAGMHIPMKWKYHQNQTKYILKKAAEGIVPHDIIYRKKIGFSSPTDQWYKKGSLFLQYIQDSIRSNGKLSGMLNSDMLDSLIKDNQKGIANYAPQLWAIQNLLGIE